MPALDIYTEMEMSAPLDGRAADRDIGQRITRLQARITSDRRCVEALQAHLATASGDDERAALAARVAFLTNEVAQHEVELTFWVARLEGRQPGR